MESKVYFESFSPRSLGGISTSPGEDVERIQRGLSFKLPAALCDLLMRIKGAVVFDKALGFTSSEPNPWQDKDGKNEIVLFYGIAPDENGLLEKNDTYRDQKPIVFIAISECSGGNLIGLNRNTGQVLFLDHEALSESESIFLVANTFDEFVEQIELATDTSNKIGQKIVQGDSYLDF